MPASLDYFEDTYSKHMANTHQVLNKWKTLIALFKWSCVALANLSFRVVWSLSLLPVTWWLLTKMHFWALEFPLSCGRRMPTQASTAPSRLCGPIAGPVEMFTDCLSRQVDMQLKHSRYKWTHTWEKLKPLHVNWTFRKWKKKKKVVDERLVMSNLTKTM